MRRPGRRRGRRTHLHGAPVPEGVDVVVPQERARREGESLWLEAPGPLRTNVRAAGVDFKAGDLLVRGGTGCTPGTSHSLQRPASVR